MYDHVTDRPSVRILIGTAVCVAFLALIYFFTPYYSTQFLWEARKALFWILPLLMIAASVGATVVVLAAVFRAGDDACVRASIGVGILGCIAAIGFWCWHGYAQDKVYADSVIVDTTAESMPELSVRTPLSVAQAQSRTTLSNIVGADLITDSTMYIPGDTEYTTLATGRHMLGNYSAVAVQKFPLTGRSEGSQCTFSDNASRSLSGTFNHNLGRSINSERRGVNWDTDDAYGLCDHEGTPWVVVPLKKQTGVFIVTERPAGVALYNGKSGEVTIHDIAPDWVRGATYPMSLVEKQRESTTASGSWMQWFRNLVGWKSAEGAAHANNSSEFVLGGADKKPLYTTPLSNQGNSTGIAAVSTVDAQAGHPGELNPYVVHVFPKPWVSVDAIESRIKADYQDIPNWQTLLVQEIAPLDAHRWVATIGNDQNTLYRVIGSGDLGVLDGASNDASTCLYQGTESKSKRCGTLALTNGNGIGTQYGPGGSPDAVPPRLDPSLKGMSDKELADLLRQIADELHSRAGG